MTENLHYVDKIIDENKRLSAALDYAIEQICDIGRDYDQELALKVVKNIQKLKKGL